MVAFILAAGYGTRLRPFTDHTPKALVRVGGVTMLERVARRCIAAGARKLVVNVSHLADQVETCLEEHRGFGVPFAVSREEGEPLETGGGIKKAAHLLPEEEDVLVHNVDVLTDIDLEAMADAHSATRPEPLATLAVVPEQTDRYLLFDEQGLLGFAFRGEERLMREAEGQARRLDFCGVQLISARLIERISAEPAEKFSVMDLYLRLAKAGEPIIAFEGSHRCLDIGTHERLAEAEAMLGEPGE